MSKNCGTCKHYQQLDARHALRDPNAVYTVCGWRPLQPYWLNPPFMSARHGIREESVRASSDGEACPTWEPK